MICSQFWKMKSFKAGFILALGRSIMVDAINFSVYENCRNFFCYQNGGNKVMWIICDEIRFIIIIFLMIVYFTYFFFGDYLSINLLIFW
jgi:hypothetical protein